MPHALLITHSNPANPEVEAEYNRWYDDEHVHDMLAIHGVRSATRYRLSDTQFRADTSHRYVAIYELDGDDIPGLVERMFAAREAGGIPISDTLASGPSTLWELISHHES